MIRSGRTNQEICSNHDKTEMPIRCPRGENRGQLSVSSGERCGLEGERFARL